MHCFFVLFQRHMSSEFIERAMNKEGALRRLPSIFTTVVTIATDCALPNCMHYDIGKHSHAPCSHSYTVFSLAALDQGHRNYGRRAPVVGQRGKPSAARTLCATFGTKETSKFPPSKCPQNELPTKPALREYVQVLQ